MKKALSIFLSALLLFSSTGFTISNHFCGGELENVKIGLSNRDANCDMMQTENDCEQHPASNKLKKSSCCANQFIHFALEDNFEKLALEKTEIDPIFLIAYSHVSAGFTPFVQQKDFNLHLYSPPLLDKDIPVLVQSFLI